MISARGLTKRLGAVRALGPVDFDIQAGETVVVFGHNGAGKSTLLRLIAGLIRPTGGIVEIEGAEPKRLKPRIGFLGHDCFLYPFLTSAENLEFFARLYRVYPTGVRPALERAGMSDKSGVLVNNLSAGELQRLGLARALLHDPDYLILDEPLSNLDRSAADLVSSVIAASDRTVVMATHDIDRGKALADRIFVLEAGHLQLPESSLEKPGQNDYQVSLFQGPTR